MKGKKPLPQNQNLLTLLKNSLLGATKIAILGIGSELRGDDICGMLAADKIQKKFFKSERIRVLLGGTAPENLSGEIRRFSPSHLIMLDAADTSQEPGTISFIDPVQVGGISFSTHMMPIKIMVDYFKEAINANSIIIGIQPKSIQFGAKPSKEVLKSVCQIVKALNSVLKSV